MAERREGDVKGGRLPARREAAAGEQSPGHALLGLQKAAGNKAVADLLSGTSSSAGAGEISSPAVRLRDGLRAERGPGQAEFGLGVQRVATGKGAAPRTLRFGTRGSDVSELQKSLGVAGDGIFGPATNKAVIEFQKQVGLVADGIVGAKTWTALDESTSKTGGGGGGGETFKGLPTDDFKTGGGGETFKGLPTDDFKTGGGGGTFKGLPTDDSTAKL